MAPLGSNAITKQLFQYFAEPLAPPHGTRFGITAIEGIVVVVVTLQVKLKNRG